MNDGKITRSGRPLVDFVVCTWNNRKLIEKTLEGIANQTFREFTCTLVDGGSTDGTPELVLERFPWVDVIVKRENSGPAESRNIGLSRGQAEYVVFVDSDVNLDCKWAEAQIDFMNANPKAGILCGKLLYALNPSILYAAYGVSNRYGVARDGGAGEPADQFNEARRCLFANSSALMVRRRIAEELKGFDSGIFAGYEDADFGWRANLLGYDVVFNPNANAIHEVHATFDPRVMKRKLIYFVWRHRLRSLLVNYGFWSLCRYTSIYSILALLDGLVYGPRREKLGALWWNVRHLLSTLRRRRWVQSRRKVGDADLWGMFESGLRGPGYDFREQVAIASSKASGRLEEIPS